MASSVEFSLVLDGSYSVGLYDPRNDLSNKIFLSDYSKRVSDVH